jgi:hypothetical protein
MTTHTRLLAALTFALALSACGLHADARSPAKTPHHDDGQPFLPQYVQILEGKQPAPVDTCQVTDLYSLLIPCDRP